MSCTTGVVVFDYSVWTARYPEFAAVLEPLAQSYFDEATLYLDNSGASKVQNVGQRALLLNMLTAHIAALNQTVNGQPVSTLVGRIANATQGSVSVGTDYGPQPATAAWFNQTKYGAAYYAASARYRLARVAQARAYPGGGW